MTMSKQIFLLLYIRANRAFLITMPIIVIYWQSFGLSMQDIFVLQVIFSIAVVLFEIPSGYFADKIGRAKSIQCGTILGTIGFMVYWFFPGFWGFALAEVILALGHGLLSGAQEAMLKESLPKKQQGDQNTKWQGRLMTTGNVSEAVAALCAGIIAAQHSLEAVLIIQWVIFAFAIPAAYMLKETRHLNNKPTPAILQILQGSVKENKRLQALNLYAAGISAGTLAMVWFSQPHWRELGVDIIYFGYLWAGLQLVVAIGAMLSHRLEAKFRYRSIFAFLCLGLVLGYLAMGLLSSSWLALIVVPVFWLLRGISNPIVIDYVQREAKEEETATVLSVNKLATRLVFSIFSPFLGWLVDVWSFATAFYASALIFGTVCGIGLILLNRSFRSAT